MMYKKLLIVPFRTCYSLCSYGQAGKRLPSSGIMGGPQLTPQETRAYTATTIADVLQQQQQTHQQQQHQQDSRHY